MDALFEYRGKFYHIEIQSNHLATMEWRMLDYILKITSEYGELNISWSRNVRKIILYIGTPMINWKLQFNGTSLSFECDTKDIRDIFETPSDLFGLGRPIEDWILGVVCIDNPQDKDWERTARKIATAPDDGNTEELAFKLPVMAALREKTASFIKALDEIMLDVDLSKSSKINDIIDDIRNEELLIYATNVLYDTIHDFCVNISDIDLYYIDHLDLNDIDELRQAIRQRKDISVIIGEKKRKNPFER